MAARSLAAACLLTVAVCAVLHAAGAHTVDPAGAAAPTAGGIGSACNTSSNCSANMVCPNKTCQCSNNSVPVNGSCLSGIGSACNTSSNCSSNMVCQIGKCQCSNNSVPVNGNCLNVTTTWGGPCEINAQCRNWNKSECLNKKCACPGGLTFVNNTCRNIGDGNTCNATNNCPANMVCESGSCRCNSSSILVNGRCLNVTTSWGGPCEDNAQCRNWNESVCSNKKCACPSGLTFVNNTCRNIAPPCSGSTCPGGASCTSGKCVCSKDQLYVDGRCVQTQGKVDEKCKQDLLCYLPNDKDQHVECKSQKCKCSNGYKPNKKKDSCVSGASLSFVTSAVTVLLALVVSTLT